MTCEWCGRRGNVDADADGVFVTLGETGGWLCGVEDAAGAVVGGCYLAAAVEADVAELGAGAQGTGA